MIRVATCIGCGCRDDDACVNEFSEACAWRKVDRKRGLGVCSFCPITLIDKLKEINNMESEKLN